MKRHSNRNLSSHPLAPSAILGQENVLFIGNLSFFCEERHLFELFNQYGPVEKVVITHNVEHTKSLLFGFVTMSTVHAAHEILRLFDGHMFMGRNMK
jgi:RNA recognition motif-containing protein